MCKSISKIILCSLAKNKIVKNLKFGNIATNTEKYERFGYQMKTRIFCKTTSKGVQSFYLQCNDGTFFLFCQNYRRGVKEYFSCGVTLSDALDFSHGGTNSAIKKTKEKLPSYIRYIEREYDISVLEKTIKKKGQRAGCKLRPAA